ncbi:DUF6883 domain-containing protein [Brevundimonas nasdae]|uniref:DUF6883 domain-containing protein n=1 Tax=Brevundimonas nasdae TaxID=172043 RepID=UPI00289B4232|nr:DUF6883 domain-containing protein [Brevundimonas nasdae]
MKLYVFLFDEDHPELNGQMFIGPPCTSRVVRAIEPEIKKPLQILRGGIVAHIHAYRTAEIGIGAQAAEEEGLRVTSDTIHRKPDMRIQSVLIGELYENLFNASRIVDRDRLLTALMKCSIWSVGVFPISLLMAERVHAKILEFEPYLGFAEVDLGNPFLFDAFVSSMFHDDLVVDGNGIYIRSDPYADKLDRDDAIESAKSHGSSFVPTALTVSDFQRIMPSVKREEISERGIITIRRIKKVSEPTQRENLANGIYEKFTADKPSEPLRFIVTDPANKSPVYVSEDKIRKYLLNLDHSDGGPKAKFFKDVLDIVEADWAYLHNQISRGWENATLYRVGRNAWSYTHGALMAVVGRNGRQVVIETGWKVSDDGPVEFVTAYPANTEREAAAATPLVVDTSLSGVEKWERVYDLAQSEASKAHDDTVPTPMFLKGYLPEWDGKCGWTDVHVSDIDHADFCDWLVAHKGAMPEKSGAQITFQSLTQSIDRSVAAAEAFSEVLAANGILSTVEPILD